MTIPLQPINLAPYKANPGLTVEQIGAGLQQMADENAQRKMVEEKAKEMPIMLKAEMQRSKVLSGSPWTASPPDEYGNSLFYNKQTGQTYHVNPKGEMTPVTPVGISPPQNQSHTVAPASPHPHTHVSIPTAPVQKATPSLGAAGDATSHQAIPAAHTVAGVQSTPSFSGAALSVMPTSMNGGIGEQAASLGYGLPSNVEGNIDQMTGSKYSRGGTQEIITNPQTGENYLMASPTRTTTSAGQTTQMGLSGYESIVPYLDQAQKDWGGRGTSIDFAKFLQEPRNEAHARKLALLLAIQRMKPTISSDLSRLSKSGDVTDRSMAHYATSAMQGLPSTALMREYLKIHPNYANKINLMTQKYYNQLEEKIGNARKRTAMLGSSTPLGKNITTDQYGQPIAPS